MPSCRRSIVTSNIPNLISCFRLICILLCLYCPHRWRLPILLVAIVSDFLDGFLARRWGAISRLGVLMDPLADKGMAAALSYLYWTEGCLRWDHLAILFSRDLVILLFGTGLMMTGEWKQWTIQSFWCGKVATTLQAMIFLFLVIGDQVPVPFLVLMGAAAIVAPFELFYLKKSVFEPIPVE